MSKSKKPPFDPIDAAIRVREGKLKYADMSTEEVALTRAAFAHSGRLRTEILRRTPDRPKLPAASHFHRALS